MVVVQNREEERARSTRPLDVSMEYASRVASRDGKGPKLRNSPKGVGQDGAETTNGDREEVKERQTFLDFATDVPCRDEVYTARELKVVIGERRKEDVSLTRAHQGRDEEGERGAKRTKPASRKPRMARQTASVCHEVTKPIPILKVIGEQVSKTWSVSSTSMTTPLFVFVKLTLWNPRLGEGARGIKKVAEIRRGGGG